MSLAKNEPTNRSEEAESLLADVSRLFAPDASVIADPYPLYARLRAEGPAYRFGDRVLVTHYDEARDVIKASTTRQGLAAKGAGTGSRILSLLRDSQTRLAEMFTFYEKRLAGVDGDKHRRLRILAQKAFTPRVVAQMSERIQAIVDEMLEGFGGQPIEFVSDFAFHVPLIVISEMLDIPREDREQLREWSCDLGHFVGADWASDEVVDTTHTSLFEMREYLRDIVVSRRGSGAGPLLQGLLEAEGDDGDKFTQDELVAMITQLVFAGHETTTNLLGNSMVAMLRDRRDQWDLLVEQPDLVPTAVEELLRFVTPTQYIEKLAAEEGEIGGVHVRQWDTVSVVLAAANRDPAVFDRPDELDITAERKGHIAFGVGPHHCLGAALTRLEAATVLRTLVERHPSATLTTGDVAYAANSMLRGPAELWVDLGR